MDDEFTLNTLKITQIIFQHNKKAAHCEDGCMH